MKTQLHKSERNNIASFFFSFILLPHSCFLFFHFTSFFFLAWTSTLMLIIWYQNHEFEFILIRFYCLLDLLYIIHNKKFFYLLFIVLLAIESSIILVLCLRCIYNDIRDVLEIPNTKKSILYKWVQILSYKPFFKIEFRFKVYF